MSQQVGLIGLGVMGENLALNIERHGFSVTVYNRTATRTEEFLRTRAAGRRVTGAYSVEGLVASLERPRRILLMVKAGSATDEVLGQLAAILEPGDTIADGGNSHFSDTERRGGDLAAAGLLYLGVGISGGQEGALNGPSIMPGGTAGAYTLWKPILEAIAALVDERPCVTHVGPGGAGHYVKMVHNGIEYADMQLIAEAYDILRRGLGMRALGLSGLFAEWNQGELSSFLIEISADIFARMDDETGLPLADSVVDEAEQKGTGRWASQNALDLGVPTPTISAAVEARILSALKSERLEAARVLPGPAAGGATPSVHDVRDALYAAKVCSYAQGMSLLRAASHEYSYGLDLSEIARIWRGGCIIRARLLEGIQLSFAAAPDRANLLLDARFGEAVATRQAAWRHVVQAAVGMGIPCPAMAASLAYYDGYRSERLPANLIQAQRDYFGAHGYRRVDRDGTFHSDWRPR